GGAVRLRAWIGGLPLRSLVDRVVFVVLPGHRVLELPHPLAELPTHLGQALRPEDEEQHEQQDQELPDTDSEGHAQSVATAHTRCVDAALSGRPVFGAPAVAAGGQTPVARVGPKGLAVGFPRPGPATIEVGVRTGGTSAHLLL